jgi:poly-gamma-glutamate capsule biosynthesis protein CapA/YwtB (metallophosphatase superfamily)
VRLALIPLLPITAVLIGCTEQPIAPPPKPPRIFTRYNRLLFAGDVMLARGVRRQILASGDPALPFRKIALLFSAADLAFVNLESPFSDRGLYHEDGLIFHASPNAIAGLQLAHIAVASTANNHSRDCGAHGVDFTVQWLFSHGIAPVGSSQSEAATHCGVVLERSGIRFGFLGYTYDQQNGNWRDIDPRIALADRAVVARDVKDIRKRCDVVIVSMHNGIEYTSEPTQSQVTFAHAAIDAGATLVIGHHPHVIQPKENYRGGLIFYSLGNLVFDQFQRQATQHGEIAEVDFLGRGIFVANVWPVKITPTGPEIE